MAEKEKLIIDGKTYEVEVGKNIFGGNPTCLTCSQLLKINGQSIELQGNTNKKETEVLLFAQNQSKDKFINNVDREEFRNYKGLEAKEIYKVLETRVANGHATSLEKCAVYYLNYNEMKKAELKAKGTKDENIEINYAHLTEDQISGKEALPDLAKQFPWAYATESVISLDNKIAGIPFVGQAARYRNACRQELTNIRAKRDFATKSEFGEEQISWLAQNDTHEALSNQRLVSEVKGKVAIGEELDEGTQRLVAAANTKAAQKEAEAKATNRQADIINHAADYNRT